jgi:proton-dependent oligopeptide transporter, POT family
VPGTGARSVSTKPQGASTDELFGHPKGLYVCFFTEMWERFSFYGMKALLLLYLTKYHLFTDHAGYDLLGAYGGLVYCTPVLGGLLADRWLGMRKSVIFGGVLLCLGHLGMAFEGEAATSAGDVIVRDDAALRVFYGSLSLIVLGVGFLKPNISTIVGKLYPPEDARRDSGFSVFYAGINLGALFASLVCGYLGETLGWRYGFGAAGIGMLLGLALFVWGQKYLQGHAEPPDQAALRERVAGVSREWVIYGGALLGLVPLATLLWAAASGTLALGGEISLTLLLMLLVFAAVLAWFFRFVTKQCTPVERDRMLALLALIFMALVFFTLYEQTYGSWVTFTDRLLTKDLFPSFVRPRADVVWTDSAAQNLALFASHAPWSMVSLVLAPSSFVVAARLSDRRPGSVAPKLVFATVLGAMLVLLVRDLLVLPQTAGSLTFLGALFIVLLAPLFTALWGWLGERSADPSKPTKSAFGLLFAGLSFLPLAFAAQQVGATGEMASVWWLVLAYFVLVLGEMCLSPVGLSAVTALSVPRVVSLMMGTWFLATAFSETLAALLGKLAAVDPHGSLDPSDIAGKYRDLFWLLAALGLAFSIVAFVLAAPLRRRMHGLK